MTKSEYYITIYLIGIVLLWYHVFGYVGLQSYSSLFNSACYLLSIFMFLYSFKEINIRKHPLLTLLLCSTFISMFMTILLWGQDFMSVIKDFRTYYLILVFFFLCKIRSKEEPIEKALVILAVIYVVCWLYQIYKVPELIFGMNRDDNLSDTESRGFYRFWIPTKENMPILLFFLFEMFRRTKNVIYIVLTAGIFLIIILHVGRQMIFWSFISFVLFLIYNYRKRWLSLTIGALLLYYVGNLMIENIPTIEMLTNITESQIQYSQDDIRANCINYYWQQSTSNPLGFLFGHGVTNSAGNGHYSKFLMNAEIQGFYLSDIGYVALLYNFGLLGIIIYALIFMQMLKLKVDDKYIYLKFYLIYIYGTYIFSHALTTNIFFNMCVLYILYASNRRIKSVKV